MIREQDTLLQNILIQITVKQNKMKSKQNKNNNNNNMWTVFVSDPREDLIQKENLYSSY